MELLSWAHGEFFYDKKQIKLVDFVNPKRVVDGKVTSIENTNAKAVVFYPPKWGYVTNIATGEKYIFLSKMPMVDTDNIYSVSKSLDKGIDPKIHYVVSTDIVLDEKEEERLKLYKADRKYSAEREKAIEMASLPLYQNWINENLIGNKRKLSKR